jgi:hypothetical protein
MIIKHKELENISPLILWLISRGFATRLLGILWISLSLNFLRLTLSLLQCTQFPQRYCWELWGSISQGYEVVLRCLWPSSHLRKTESFQTFLVKLADWLHGYWMYYMYLINMLYCQSYVSFINYTTARHQESILNSSVVSRPFSAKHWCARVQHFSRDHIFHFFSDQNNTLILF